MKRRKGVKNPQGFLAPFLAFAEGKKVGSFRLETVRKSLENKKIKKVKKSVDISHEIIV